MNLSKMVNDFIMLLQSSTYTQKYLLHCYTARKENNAKAKSMHNTSSFIYYLMHGQTYFSSAHTSPFTIQPILLFYGMTQWMKACLLTVDAHYPQTTSVLAHGVTTRKKKKQQFELLYDEIKIQSDGLFTHFSDKMFHVKHFVGKKYKMIDLLLQIPELSYFLDHLYNRQPFAPVTMPNDYTIILTDEALHAMGMNKKQFLHLLYDEIDLSHINHDDHEEGIQFFFKQPLSLTNCHPFHFHLETNRYLVSTSKLSCSFWPEIIIYYLILYNLSMLCRYDTMWWSEICLTPPSDEHLLVKKFLSLCEIKIPHFLFTWLIEQTDYPLL